MYKGHEKIIITEESFDNLKEMVEYMNNERNNIVDILEYKNVNYHDKGTMHRVKYVHATFVIKVLK